MDVQNKGMIYSYSIIRHNFLIKQNKWNYVGTKRNSSVISRFMKNKRERNYFVVPVQRIRKYQKGRTFRSQKISNWTWITYTVIN